MAISTTSPWRSTKCPAEISNPAAPWIRCGVTHSNPNAAIHSTYCAVPPAIPPASTSSAVSRFHGASPVTARERPRRRALGEHPEVHDHHGQIRDPERRARRTRTHAARPAPPPGTPPSRPAARSAARSGPAPPRSSATRSRCTSTRSRRASARPAAAPAGVVSCASTPVSCVITNTKTRSKNSSSVETRTTSSLGAAVTVIKLNGRPRCVAAAGRRDHGSAPPGGTRWWSHPSPFGLPLPRKRRNRAVARFRECPRKESNLQPSD